MIFPVFWPAGWDAGCGLLRVGKIGCGLAGLRACGLRAGLRVRAQPVSSSTVPTPSIGIALDRVGKNAGSGRVNT